MPLFAIPFPAISPVAIAFGPFAIRWYALAYIAGLLIGWRYCLYLTARPPALVRANDIDDFLVWATLGVVLGGRIGYILFYNLRLYLQQPRQMLEVWHGGMSFHGGALGVTLALYLFTRKRGLRLFALADIISEAIPIGLFFGRIANFINAELYGRPAPLWARGVAVIYPTDPLQIPRWPSEIFEAVLEGICLFLVLFVAERRGLRQRPGLVTGILLAGYAVARITGEFFRQPDPQRGYFTCSVLCTTEGQILSLPVLAAGIAIIWWAARTRTAKAKAT
ncbi:MAG TPA: prolipoprotein diacylglyceryl transferase [Stellaceae bacterium]|nr:prolipoprotein diacylglyceryl transferase [Stellaceae bacterium]